MSPPSTPASPTADPDAAGEGQVLINTELEEPRLFSFGGGNAAAYTCRCPGKETLNEDSLAALPTSPTSGLLAVADGMGGERCGDRASAATIAALGRALREEVQGAADHRPAILNGIERANRDVMDLGVGAGSTLALVEVWDDRVRPYHVGDSMILLVGLRGRIKWQTVPHSPVGYAVEAGVLDEHDAIHHADRHLVSNIVGTEGMRIEIGPRLKMAPRDTLVVASDGLFDNLQVPEIIEIVRKGKLQAAIQRLVALVRQRMHGGNDGQQQPSKPDDTSVLLFRHW